MSKAGVGIIGCGGRGRGVAQATLAGRRDIELVGVADPNPIQVKATLDAINPHGRVYADYRELLADPAIDWVIIASPNRLHREHAVAAFEAGKHVFCEKPLATTLEDGLAMRAAWRRSGRLACIGFTLRWSPHYQRIHELIEQGVIGGLISMEFNETIGFNHGGYIHGDWRRKRGIAGSHLLEKCCHDIDLVNWIVGSRARRVASFGGLDFFTPQNRHHVERLGPGPHGEKAYSAWLAPGYEHVDIADPFSVDKDIIDNQVAIIEYANGVRATFHTNCNAGIPERRMYLLGSEGAIRADVITGRIELQRIGWDTGIEDFSTDARGGHGDGDHYLSRELADSMLNGTQPRAGISDGLASAATCLAIDEAMDTGTVVDCASYWARVDGD